MLAVAAFAALCAVVLSVAPQLGVEPDDGAYRASIVAMTEGHFLTLSSAQTDALAGELSDGRGIPSQWVELSDGRYISENDSGYPLLAAPFQALGILRWAPLAAEASSQRRTWAGLAGFAAIEIATFARYTDIMVLGCAVVTVIWRGGCGF